MQNSEARMLLFGMVMMFIAGGALIAIPYWYQKAVTAEVAPMPLQPKFTERGVEYVPVRHKRPRTPSRISYAFEVLPAR